MTMWTTMAAMDAEFGTPLDTANQAERAAQVLPEQVARRARAARCGALVGRVDETQEEP